MSENLLKLFGNDVATKDGAQMRALRTFLEIEKHHGEDETRRIFARLGKKPGKLELKEREGFRVLERYDTMEPRPNVDQLARQIAGETGRTFETAKAYINEQRRKRRDKIVAGTWAGPPYFGSFDDWGKDEG
jgi:hypothetical protein